ncbi:MAG: hypothetical protein M1503_06075 [Thaumarchaeota archaeon]|nr:hypothetical protein [Nitrososphaerota archaeon]MCL5317810.1 hypothetical protein [Nitrososphaerota archaeon]
MRPKTIRIIESIHSKGVFGPCSCGGEVLYYTDRGVRCSTCGKLYGVWANRPRALLSRAKEILAQEPTTGEVKEIMEDVTAESVRGKAEEDYSEFVTEEDEVEVATEPTS